VQSRVNRRQIDSTYRGDMDTSARSVDPAAAEDKHTRATGGETAPGPAGVAPRSAGSAADLLRDATERRSLQGAAAARLADLQRSAGNQHVLRIVRSALSGAAERAPRRGPPIQRYAVNQPGTASAQALVTWLNGSSPHHPAWAKTRATFTWGRTMTATPVEGEEGQYRVTVADSAVTLTKSVDMPTWTAATPPMQQAWDSMWAELRAHEAEHETIADTWKSTLETRLGEAEYTVSATSVDAANTAGRAQADADWTTWIAEHQTDQNAIDPFFATLVEPPAEDEEESAVTEEFAIGGDE
jgi:predicted secreted Zn-dependent protease